MCFVKTPINMPDSVHDSPVIQVEVGVMRGTEGLHFDIDRLSSLTALAGWLHLSCLADYSLVLLLVSVIKFSTATLIAGKWIPSIIVSGSWHTILRHQPTERRTEIRCK